MHNLLGAGAGALHIEMGMVVRRPIPVIIAVAVPVLIAVAVPVIIAITVPVIIAVMVPGPSLEWGCSPMAQRGGSTTAGWHALLPV